MMVSILDVHTLVFDVINYLHDENLESKNVHDYL